MTGMIYVGADVLEKRLPTLTCGQKNFVVTDSNVYALYPEFFKTELKNPIDTVKHFVTDER